MAKVFIGSETLLYENESFLLFAFELPENIISLRARFVIVNLAFNLANDKEACRSL